LERLGNIDFAKFNIGYIGKNDQAPWAIHQKKRNSLLMFERGGLFHITEILVVSVLEWTLCIKNWQIIVAPFGFALQSTSRFQLSFLFVSLTTRVYTVYQELTNYSRIMLNDHLVYTATDFWSPGWLLETDIHVTALDLVGLGHWDRG
jgi:hypothetical protein